MARGNTYLPLQMAPSSILDTLAVLYSYTVYLSYELITVRVSSLRLSMLLIKEQR